MHTLQIRLISKKKHFKSLNKSKQKKLNNHLICIKYIKKLLLLLIFN